MRQHGDRRGVGVAREEVNEVRLRVGDGREGEGEVEGEGEGRTQREAVIVLRVDYMLSTVYYKLNTLGVSFSKLSNSAAIKSIIV